MSTTSTVLIVEDSALIRQIYHLSLESTHFQIVGEAKTGFEAITLLRQTQPNILLLDLVLPEMSGIEVLKRLKDISFSTKTLVITSIDDSEILNQVRGLGAADVLQKPFTLTALFKALNSLNSQLEVLKHG